MSNRTPSRRALAKVAGVVLLALSLGACATTQPEIVLSKKSSVELRAMQSRAFETADQPKVYRAVLATFQDLGYTISKVEPAAGTVTADKLAQLTMTATVYPRGVDRTIVRSNAVVKMSPAIDQGHQVDSPEFYQQRFFEPLSKSLFLTALTVDDTDEPIQQAEHAGPASAADANSAAGPAPAVTPTN